MKTRLSYLFLVLLLPGLSSTSLADKAEPDDSYIPPPPPEPVLTIEEVDSGYVPAKEGKTIYVNISGLASRSQHAKKITALHKEQAAQGWTVISVIPLLENGDLEGFYVTYTRESL